MIVDIEGSIILMAGMVCWYTTKDPMYFLATVVAIRCNPRSLLYGKKQVGRQEKTS